MSDKYIKEITQNIPNNELNAACDALMNNSLNETSDYEEVSMEELNEYIEGLECQAEDLRTQLAKANESYKELFSAFESCQGELKNANERVRDLEAQLKRIIDYEADQTLLPEASSQGTRQLVNDIKNDATDVGGCYEVSCGLLDSLFEHYTDKGASKLLNKFAIENKAEALSAVKNEIKTVGGLELCDVTEFIDEQLEQLRKERE